MTPPKACSACCHCGDIVKLVASVDVHGDGSFEVDVLACPTCRDSAIVRSVRVEGDRYRTLTRDEPNPR